jgi:hypothetical protein
MTAHPNAYKKPAKLQSLTGCSPFTITYNSLNRPLPQAMTLSQEAYFSFLATWHIFLLCLFNILVQKANAQDGRKLVPEVLRAVTVIIFMWMIVIMVVIHPSQRHNSRASTSMSASPV